MVKLLRVGIWRITYQKRAIHNEVRVRFAPSPTGLLHLGGLRTALYNYLFAKQCKGKFLLRIEDTDQTRSIPGATESIIEDLLWSGIEIDEGPGFGGGYGPYKQSERKHFYADAVDKLLANGTAYKCFCSERRLDLLRKDAIRRRQIPRYDNKCRDLTEKENRALDSSGKPSCIRFKLRTYTKPIDDMVYGPVTHNVVDNEGDPVIMKSDGFPTYHFANVIDDHMMGITHVFRGVEWQISTTKHLLMYNAFDWQPPIFAHLPLLVNTDGSKLSKRQGDISIGSFRDKGYFPNALVNYILSAGGGFNRTQSEIDQIYAIRELVPMFAVNRIGAHPSRLNPVTLDNFNRLEIIRQLENTETTKELVAQVQSLVRNAFPNNDNLDLDDEHVEAVLKWSVARISLLSDLISNKLSFLWIKPSNLVLKDLSQVQLERLIAALAHTESFATGNLSRVLRAFAKGEELKYPVLMKCLRSVLSGLDKGPSVAEMIEILGKNAVLQRLRYVSGEESKTEAIKSL